MPFRELAAIVMEMVKRWPSSFSIVSMLSLCAFILWSLGAVGDDGFVRQSEFAAKISKLDTVVMSLEAIDKRSKRWYGARIADTIREKALVLCDRKNTTAYERTVLNREIEALQEEYADNHPEKRRYEVPPCSLL